MIESVGEGIGRSGISAAPPLRFPPAGVAAQAAQNQHPRIRYEKSPLLRRCHGYFPGGVDHTRRKNQPQTKNLHEAPVWRTRLGFVFRRKCPRTQQNWTGCHVGCAASAKFPGDSVARPEKTPTGSKHSNQEPYRGRGLRYLPGCSFPFGRLADQWWRYD